MLTSHLTSGSKLSIYWEGRLLCEYRFGQDMPKSYFHPVHLPKGGLLTLDSPHDHPWHRGIFFSWKFINGVNFWEENLPESERGYTHTYGLLTEQQAKHCLIRQQLNWKLPDGTVLMDESRVICVHAPDENGHYFIDYDMRFQPLSKVILDRVSPEKFDWGGYAGLSVRPARSMQHAKFVNAHQNTDLASIHGKPASWCDFSGHLDGGSEWAGGVAIFDHPDNARFQAPFYVWDDSLLQFLQSAVLFKGLWALETHDAIRLQYRVFIHDGFLEHATIEDHYQRFVKGK